MRCLRAVLLLALFNIPLVRANDHAPKGPPGEIVVERSDSGPSEVRGYGKQVTYEAALDNVVVSKIDGIRDEYVSGLVLNYRRNVVDERGKSVRFENRNSSFPKKLRTGEIIPFAGAIYQITELHRGSRVVLRLLRGGELPKGAEPYGEDYAVMPGASFGFGDHWLTVGEVAPGGDKHPSAEIVVGTVDKRDKPIRVKVDDTIAIGDVGYRVIAIVLPDSKKQVRGWVIIAPVLDLP